MIEFDHAVIRVNDFILAERFYQQVFGGIFGDDLVHVEHRSMNSTEEYVHTAQTGGTGARAAEADEKRGLQTGEPVRVSGVRLVGIGQGSVQIGGALIPMFLARKHEQEPPPEQLRGSPRHAFPVTQKQMDRAIEVLRKHDVDFEGPVDHPPQALVKRSLYFKDPSSNFLELCVPAE
ncbi:MAG: hypothetical protein HW416_1582 [Chloroflexi bacterium]|nr:hypothetical protein [Chloroflexota bacterium]